VTDADTATYACQAATDFSPPVSQVNKLSTVINYFKDLWHSLSPLDGKLQKNYKQTL
jgi:hypothetical protein